MGLFSGDKCEACGMKFESKDELVAHNKKAHGKGQNFECKACGMSLNSEKELMNHNKKAHKM